MQIKDWTLLQIKDWSLEGQGRNSLVVWWLGLQALVKPPMMWVWSLVGELRFPRCTAWQKKKKKNQLKNKGGGKWYSPDHKIQIMLLELCRFTNKVDWLLIQHPFHLTTVPHRCLILKYLLKWSRIRPLYPGTKLNLRHTVLGEVQKKSWNLERC